jgi:hypothetical protein
MSVTAIFVLYRALKLAASGRSFELAGNYIILLIPLSGGD